MPGLFLAEGRVYDEHEATLLTGVRHSAIPGISDRFEVHGKVHRVRRHADPRGRTQGERRHHRGGAADKGLFLAAQKAHQTVGLIALLRKDHSQVPVEGQAPLER